MPDIEELEHRVTKLESLYEDVLREKLTAITARLDRLDARLDRLYEKTERDKTELKTEIISRISDVLAKTEKDKTDILTKTEHDKTELISKIADVLTKTEKDKRELIYWMVGLSVGFLTLAITAMWAILSFALKQ